MALKKVLPPVVLVGLLAGCATDYQRTIAEGAGVGTAVGAGAGYGIGGRDGALIGSAIGALAGGLIGHHFAEKKSQYAEREDTLKAAVIRSEAVAQQARAANEVLQRDIATLEVNVSQLRTRHMTASHRRKLAISTRRLFEKTNQGLSQQLASVRSELTRQHALMQREQELAQLTNEPSPPAALRQVNANIQYLSSNERALEHAKAQLELLDARRAF